MHEDRRWLYGCITNRIYNSRCASFELVVGALFMEDDESKELYTSWYKVGVMLRDDESLTNESRKKRLIERIETDWKVRHEEYPSETDLMLTFYTVVKDVNGGFEETS